MIFELLPLILLGFSLGLLHALDADHVMAVSALSNQKPSLRQTVYFSANWALGHGGVLLIAGGLLFGLGIAIPETLQRAAEMSVGVLLIGLGLYLFWQFRQRALSVKPHSHGDLTHTHLHDDTHVADQNKPATKAGHLPVMVGMVHGLAGSAPALALVPLAGKADMTVVISYLLCFSLGVMLSMMMFGLGLGSLQKLLLKRSEKLLQFSRGIVALMSTVLGTVWLYQAI